MDKESVEKTLASVGRKLYCIIGDGNCRALSYIIYGTEDNHCVVRSTLVHFSELNAKYFEQYCTSGTVQDHIKRMKHERVWATQMEVYAAASCFQRTIYVHTKKNGNGNLYWERIDPVKHHLLNQVPNDYRIQLHPFLVHFELSHNVCHYDVITLFSGQLSTEPPQIASTTSFIDLTSRV